jgi:hypothetical protein
MGWIWIPAVVGSLIGWAAWVDHRRYRGLPVSPELSGPAKRKAVLYNRLQMRHLETPPRDSGYIPGGGGSAGDGGGGGG